MKRAIGRTGISVHPIGFGAWPLSNVNRPSEEQALEVIARAVDAGVDLIDTADAYCLDEHDFGHNERLICKALDAIGDKSEVTVATKAGSLRPGGAWTRCGRPEHIRTACEGSLQRLGVETITLYQLHAPDENVPLEETVGAMRDLQKEGKVVHIGMSNFDRDQLERAQREARIESLQNQCNPWTRGDVDSGLLEHCREMDVTYIAWYPRRRGDRPPGLRVAPGAAKARREVRSQPLPAPARLAARTRRPCAADSGCDAGREHPEQREGGRSGSGARGSRRNRRPRLSEYRNG